MAEEVKLFGMWASPFCHLIEIALKLKGMKYQYIEEDLSNKSPELLKYNPVHKKVPVLLHNGNPIAESLIILEYLDEIEPNNPLLPKSPYARSQARFWSKYVLDNIVPTYLKSNAAEGKEKEQILEEVHHQILYLENLLKGKEFFGGESIGYLDIVIFCMLQIFRVNQEVVRIELINDKRFPLIWKWLEKLLEISEIRESVPPKEKHMAYIKARIEAIKASTTK